LGAYISPSVRLTFLPVSELLKRILRMDHLNFGERLGADMSPNIRLTFLPVSELLKRILRMDHLNFGERLGAGTSPSVRCESDCGSARSPWHCNGIEVECFDRSNRGSR
jgi:hypothetical protein